jgi:membrane associated rhomboid family serine protease
VSARPRGRDWRIDWSRLRITRGALIVLGIQLGLSLIWLMGDKEVRLDIEDWVLASPSQVFERYRVWTLVTSPLLERGLLTLLLTGLMMYMIVPTLERFWGTGRFLRFVAITSVFGSAAGCLVGWLLGSDVAINGLSPMIIAAVVAFGIIYARQPVQFFGVLPLSGREFMFGLLAVFALSVILQGHWEQGAAQAAAAITAVIMTSKRWSPGLAWKRWRIARARARLSVIEGGVKPAKPKSDEQRFLN